MKRKKMGQPASSNNGIFSWLIVLAMIFVCIMILAVGSVVTTDPRTLPEHSLTERVQSSTSDNSILSTSAIHRTKILYKIIEQGELERSQDRFQKYAAFHAGRDDEKPLTFQEWISILTPADQNDANEIRSFANVLAECPFDAFYFETPPVTVENVNRQRMEFVLVESPGLFRFAHEKADPNTFAQQFERADCKHAQFCIFDNLKKDTILIAPTPKLVDSNLNAYGHLAAFVRRASTQQIEETIWHAILEYGKHITRMQESNNFGEYGTKPLWFSTHGGGVSWLHFRLDTFPKYYSYRSYKKLLAQSDDNGAEYSKGIEKESITILPLPSH